MDLKKPAHIDKAIQYFIQGNASSEEQKLLVEWLKENPENRRILFGEKDLWESAQINSEKLNQIEMEQWIELQERIAEAQDKSYRFREILRIAAIIVIAIGAGWLGHFIYSENQTASQVEIKTVEAFKGQIKEVFLADGTHIWLNADSKLLFPSNFNTDKREIELEGEAYFEVTSNEENPFLVKTKNHTIKVTGTQFNVCEYPESNIIETTLVEGKVKIITGNIIKDLKPGQQSSFSTLTSEVRINKADFEIYTSWKEGRYEFKNEPIEKIIKIAERWWDVKINYPEAHFKYERISGVLRKHKTLQQHLDVFKELVQFEYEIENDAITITSK